MDGKWQVVIYISHQIWERRRPKCVGCRQESSPGYWDVSAWSHTQPETPTAGSICFTEMQETAEASRVLMARSFYMPEARRPGQNPQRLMTLSSWS